MTNFVSLTLSHRKRLSTSFFALAASASFTRILSPGCTLAANTEPLSIGTKCAGVNVSTRPDLVVNRMNCLFSDGERSKKAITSLYTTSPWESTAAIRSPRRTSSNLFVLPSSVRTRLLPGKQPPDLPAEDDSESECA